MTNYKRLQETVDKRLNIITKINYITFSCAPIIIMFFNTKNDDYPTILPFFLVIFIIGLLAAYIANTAFEWMRVIIHNTSGK